jgi:hypothetical protein
MQALDHQVRYVKLLRADEKVGQFVKQRSLAHGLSAIANAALRLRRRQRSAKDIEFAVHEAPCGAEFDAVNGETSDSHVVRGLRTARYLNWRYVEHPLKRYSIVTARRRSALAGYAVLEIDGRHATLADLQSAEIESVLPGLLAFCERVTAGMNVCSVSAPVLPGCHIVPYLRQAGFQPRECAPVIAHVGGSAAAASEAGNWFLLFGDRES